MSAKSKSSGDTVPSLYHLISFILTKSDSDLDKLTSCNCSFTMHETNCRQLVSLGVSSVLSRKLPLQILQFHALNFLYSPAISAVSVRVSPTVHTWLKYVLYRISCLICHKIFFFNDLSNCLHMLDDCINKYHLPRLQTYLRSCPFIFPVCVTYKQVIIILCCLRLPLEELQRYLSRIIGHECNARPETNILTKP